MVKTKTKTSKLATLVAGLWIGVILGAALLFGLNWLGVIQLDFSQLSQSLTPNIAPGKDMPAPDFTLLNLVGRPYQISGLRGKVIVLNFWATWCGPCVREMPMFQEAQDQYPESLIVLGVNEEEARQSVSDFIAELGVTYEILLDEPGDVGNLYQVLALPTTFFIDRDGVIRYHHTGVMTKDQLNVYLSQLGVTP